MHPFMLFPSTRLSTQLTQIATQAPFVMAMRMGDWLAMPGGAASAQQQRELGRMVAEKQAAAMEAWFGLAGQAWTAWAQGLHAPLSPLPAAQWDRMGQAVVAPYARRVRANATRLHKRKR